MGKGGIHSDYRRQQRERDENNPLSSMHALTIFGIGSITEKVPTRNHSVKSNKPKKHQRNKR